jgi:hypothetical protein
VRRLFDIRFGNHVGDWEHQMVRFTNGSPTGVYISAHDAGTAYAWGALPFAANGTRPITYIAQGDHANYGTAGRQPYPVPILGPIADQTSAGVLWDTTLNFRGFWFDHATRTFAAAGGAGAGGAAQANESVSWLQFLGQWGDDTPPTNILKNEQYCISTECHYTAGPTGEPSFAHVRGILITCMKARLRRISVASRFARTRRSARSRRPLTPSCYPRTSRSASRTWLVRFARPSAAASFEMPLRSEHEGARGPRILA